MFYSGTHSFLGKERKSHFLPTAVAKVDQRQEGKAHGPFSSSSFAVGVAGAAVGRKAFLRVLAPVLRIVARQLCC